MNHPVVREEPGERGARLWPWVLLVLLLLLAGGFLLCGDRERAVVDWTPPSRETEEEFTRVVLLYFAAPDGERLVAERRELALEGLSREETAILLLGELARGPLDEKSFATVPPELSVRSVFFDDLGGLYIDLDGRSLTGWDWGSSSEVLALRSMVRTLSGSFPELLRVGYLVDGERRETLAGHVDALHPFEVVEWR